MTWLVRLGYAEKTHDQFCWAANVAPIMKELHLWNEQCQSFEEVRLQEEFTWAKRAWETMPDLWREKVRRGDMEFITLVKILALGWRDGEWHSFSLDDSFELNGQITLAKLIVKYAQTTAGSNR